jgi:hypothetical protein
MDWSMKNDRDLIQLAVANLSVDEIARTPKEFSRSRNGSGSTFRRLRPNETAS